MDGNGDDPSQSAQFPPRPCPKCLQKNQLCDLCNGDSPETRVVSRFKAAAWLSSHPELHDTPPEFPRVIPPSRDGKGEPE